MRIEGDIRDQIFLPVKGQRYTAWITAQGKGILSGMEWFEKACGKLGITVRESKERGQKVRSQEVVAVLEGNAHQMALAEEELLGWVSKTSGIATAARRAKMAAGKKLRVVSGAWKKMPLPVKDLVRQAVTDGGIQSRISDSPFLYLDKNYVRMLGGVLKALRSISSLKGYTVVIQLKGEAQGLLREAVLAAEEGADVIMIDTGRKEDIRRVDSTLRAKGLRWGVQIAFGGNIQIDDLKLLRRMPVDIVDIGQAIVDAPLLDFRMDIVARP